MWTPNTITCELKICAALQCKNLSNGIFFLELLCTAEPGVVNWNPVTKGESSMALATNKEFASHAFLTVWLLKHYKFQKGYSLNYLVLNPCKRSYSSQTGSSIQISSHSPQRNPSYNDHLSKAFNGETYSVLKASSLQHWFKNWQEKRKQKLTASTFGAALGFWPRRRVQLWLEKIGAIEPFSGNLATCWNNIHEEEALEKYKLITGNAILFPEFQVYGKANAEDDWLAASPDGVVANLVYGLPLGGVLEIKCPFFNGNMSMAYPCKKLPIYYVPQAQGLMEILDRDWMDFYCWTLKGSSLIRVHRNEHYWDLVNIALSDFWWKHVQPAKELYSKYTIIDPLVELKSLKPEPRHELWSSIIYETYFSSMRLHEINPASVKGEMFHFFGSSGMLLEARNVDCRPREGSGDGDFGEANEGSLSGNSVEISSSFKLVAAVLPQSFWCCIEDPKRKDVLGRCYKAEMALI
ncbi:YqaJ viral recombinase [Dillenia turbinata]|uniref:YqaJ viral recombinase n=1 Tax=Dillenia turbinata TaxID=194707 RepID=A0AAN8VFJ7_9MAGN